MDPVSGFEPQEEPMVYQCVECEQHYCTACDDGGEDSCPECHTGPRCNECAADHAESHESDAEDESC